MTYFNTLVSSVLLAAIALLLLVLAVRYFVSYAKCIRRVKGELAKARSWKDKVYWRRELDTLRLCILPGLTPDRVRAIRRCFYRGRYARRPEMNDGLGTMLIPSVLSICVCMTCLAGGTFAWFTANQSVPTQTITAANFSVQATVKKGEQSAEVRDNAYLLTTGTWKIILTPSGSADKGYCIIDFSPGETAAGAETLKRQFIGPLKKGVTYELEIEITHKQTEMMITPYWGQSTNDPTIPSKPLVEPTIPPETTPSVIENAGNNIPGSNDPGIDDTEVKNPETTPSVGDETVSGDTEVTTPETTPSGSNDTESEDGENGEPVDNS